MRWRTRARTRTAIMMILLVSMEYVGTVRADEGPRPYDYVNAKGDVVCVGDNSVQYLANFLADGDYLGHAGFNSRQPVYKFVNLDATSDANGRLAYAQTTTAAAPALLDPTLVIRAGSPPTQRPNGAATGLNALIGDVTATSNQHINCVQSSLYPEAWFSRALQAGWGGLHVVRVADDPLEFVAAQTTNAPAGLSALQLSQIYNVTPTAVVWGDLPGYGGPCPTCTIVPLLPQAGSGTRSTFLADLLAANPSFICCAPSVQQFVEENDPTAVTSNPDPADAIVPFSGSRLNLWNRGYFHNPYTPYDNNPYPGGAALGSGVVALTGTAGDGSPSYLDNRGLYFAWRAIDDNAPSWQPGTLKNWAQTLFLPSGLMATSFQAKNPVQAAGAVYDYVDCGVDTPSGTIPGCGTNGVTCPIPSPGESEPARALAVGSPSNASAGRTGYEVPAPASAVASAAQRQPVQAPAAPPAAPTMTSSVTDAALSAGLASGGTEPSIAVNPTNAAQVAITAFLSPDWRSGPTTPLLYSTNGGASFTAQTIQRPTIPAPPPTMTATPTGPWDQTIDFGQDGRLYGTFLIEDSSKANHIVTGGTSTPTVSAAWVWNDSPVTYTEQAPNAVPDQPWLVTNPAPVTGTQTNAYVGYYNVTSTVGATDTAQVAAAVGVTQSVRTTQDTLVSKLPGSCVNPGVRLAGDPRNGYIYAVYETDTATAAGVTPTVTYMLNRSTDAGVTWSLGTNPGGVVVDTRNSDQGQACGCKFAGVNALLGGVDSVAVNPLDRSVYVVYGATNTAYDQLLIRQVTATAGGSVTISPPFPVSPPTATAALPSVAVSANGTVGVLYDTWDGTGATGLPTMTAHLGLTADLTNWTDMRLQTFNSPNPNYTTDTVQRVLGDYQQMKAVGQSFYGVFSGNRNGFAAGGGAGTIDPIFFKASPP